MTSILSQAGAEIISLNADNADLREQLAAAWAETHAKDCELAKTKAGLELSRQVASSLDESLEAANARIEELNMVVHTTQDGALARDQAGVIARANARIVELEKHTAALDGAIKRRNAEILHCHARAASAEEALVELERRWQTAVARAERAEAECKRLREAAD